VGTTLEGRRWMEMKVERPVSSTGRWITDVFGISSSPVFIALENGTLNSASRLSTSLRYRIAMLLRRTVWK
jgi:hypothetical protein